MTIRRQTRYEHHERINAVIHHIHGNLADDLPVKELASIASYSPYHFQRIFKQITDESVHDYIRRSRLEWAANLLIFNPGSAVMDVAAECGFRSNASFTHAFKARFECTPSRWRQGGYATRSHQMQSQWQNRERESDREGALQVSIKELPTMRVAYLRHIGYDMSIGSVWRQLLAWAEGQGVDVSRQQMIGLHHSNPAITPLNLCRYVACLSVPESIYPRQGVDVMSIPGGLYANCRAEGVFGDLLYLMHELYHDWLPQSDYEALNIPAHALYLENHFINQSGRFVVDFRIPVRFRL